MQSKTFRAMDNGEMVEGTWEKHSELAVVEAPGAKTCKDSTRSLSTYIIHESTSERCAIRITAEM